MNKVTDEIIGDLMADMANELHGRREENKAAYQAAVLRDAPDVETILQRLHQMEVSICNHYSFLVEGKMMMMMMVVLCLKAGLWAFMSPGKEISEVVCTGFPLPSSQTIMSEQLVYSRSLRSGLR